MQRNTNRFLIWHAPAMLAMFLVASSCIPDTGGPADGGDDGGVVDWSSYAGLHIYAEKWMKDAGGKVTHSDLGPVDLLEFENTVVSQCYRTITVEMPERYLHVCDKANIDGPVARAGVPPCQYWLCRQQLAICAGYKNLSLADEIDVAESSTPPLAIDGDPWYERGRIHLSHVVNQSPTSPAHMMFDGSTLTYRVPPQRPGDRTLLYEAALEFFRAAGIESGSAFAAGCLAPGANSDFRWTNTPPPSETAPVTRRVLGLAGFQEATIRFDDVLDRLVKNETEVARLGGDDDTGIRQRRMWNGEVNSQLSALRRLYGDLDSNQYPDGLPYGTQPIDEAVEKAVNLLRASGVDLSDSTTTGQDLAENALKVIDQSLVDLVGRSLAGRAADAGADGGTVAPDVSGVARLAATDVDEYLANNGLTYEDFSRAAAYLREEGKVLERRTMDASATDAGPAVNSTYAAPPENPPVAVRQARHAPSFVRTEPVFGKLDPEAAQRGAAQATAYFRDAARLAMVGTSLSTDEKQLLAHVVQRAEARIGQASVRVEYTDCVGDGGDSGCKATFTVVNPPKAWVGALLVEGQEGRECMRALPTSGCFIENIVLAESAAGVDVPIAGGTANAYVLSTTRRIAFGTELSVFAVRDGARPEIIATDRVRDGAGKGAELPVGGTESETVEMLSGVQPQLVSLSAVFCDGTFRSFVPPLEQELTSDFDPYESSWRHYLDLAESLATEADTLGRDMLTRALEMDMRAEAAEGELRDICGDVGPVPSGDLTGSAAEACYAEGQNRTETVSLGGALCYWRHHGVQCLCDADEYVREPGSVILPPYTICDVPCPLPPSSDFDEATADCETEFRTYFGTEPANRASNPSGDTSTFEFGYVPEANGLNVFPDPDTYRRSPVDCRKLHQLRCAEEQAWFSDKGEWPEGAAYCSEDDRSRACAAPESITDSAMVARCESQARYLWENFRYQDWITPGRLEAMAASLRMDFRPFNNFRVYGGGNRLWDTWAASAEQYCPPDWPYRWAVAHNATRPQNTFCYVPTDDASEWWCQQYAAGGKAYGRTYWGAGLESAVKSAKGIGGMAWGPKVYIHSIGFCTLASTGLYADTPVVWYECTDPPGWGGYLDHGLGVGCVREALDNARSRSADELSATTKNVGVFWNTPEEAPLENLCNG